MAAVYEKFAHVNKCIDEVYSDSNKDDVSHTHMKFQVAQEMQSELCNRITACSDVILSLETAMQFFKDG